MQSTVKKRSRWGFNDVTFLMIGFGMLLLGILTAVFVPLQYYDLSTGLYVGLPTAYLFFGGLAGGLLIILAVGPFAALGRSCWRCHEKMVKVQTNTERGLLNTYYTCPACGAGKRDSTRHI
ncbi:MAG: hypothetical protein ACLP5V_07935 [Candidatus Bathyarchaeia archaeon]